MIISQANKAIFVHIQKTAGSSIQQTIRDNCPDYKEDWHGKHGFAIHGIQELGSQKWGQYFSFAFVRNPWERLVSHYAMIMERKAKLPAEMQSAIDPFEVENWNYVLRGSHDFESFIKNCTGVVNDRGTLKSFSFNQLDYISDEKGDIAVTFVGRFENLLHDVRAVFSRLDFKVGALPRTNKSRHKHYSYYYTPETRDIIAHRFKNDIDAFGYTYEDHTSYFGKLTMPWRASKKGWM